MIVLHREKVIVLKARKVGGTSFEIALSKFAEESSIITPITGADEETRAKLGFRSPQNFRYSLRELCVPKRGFHAIKERQIPMKFWNHMGAQEARAQLGRKVWNQYTKISIIRNPFDSMVSSYFWNVHEGERLKLDFESFCLMRPELVLRNKRIYEIGGENVIDIMLRYDSLTDDILAMEDRFPSLKGLESTFRKIRAKGDFRPVGATMTEMFMNAPRSRALIKDLCHDEIKRYGFQIP